MYRKHPRERTKYSLVFEQQVLKECFGGAVGIRGLGRPYGIDYQFILGWINLSSDPENGYRLGEYEREVSMKVKDPPYFADRYREIEYLRTENAYLKEMLLMCGYKRPGRKKRFITIKRLSEKGQKVSTLYAVGEVSRSGYYKYLESIQKQSTDGPLISRIEIVQGEVRFSYGAKRMAEYLSIGDKSPVNHKRVERLIGENSLNARIRKKIHPEYYHRQKRQSFKITDHRLAPNVLNREFTSSVLVRRPVTDITFINCSDGLLVSVNFVPSSST